MNAERAPIHNPFFDPKADELVATFIARVRAEVIEPWFGSPDAVTFRQRAKQYLPVAAILRFRMLAAVADLDKDTREAMTWEWLRPLPQSLLDEIQAQAADLLGPERSFMVRRAMGMMFGDSGGAALLDRLQGAPSHAHVMMGVAALVEVAAMNDVLALGWMMLLERQLDLPPEDVREAAATALLRSATLRGKALRRLEGRPTSAQDYRLRPISIQTSKWLEAHPGLHPTIGALLGHALMDDRVDAIEVGTMLDPEAETLSFLSINLQVGGGTNPELVLVDVEEQALRSGALGVLADSRGGMVALLATCVS